MSTSFWASLYSTSHLPQKINPEEFRWWEETVRLKEYWSEKLEEPVDTYHELVRRMRKGERMQNIVFIPTYFGEPEERELQKFREAWGGHNHSIQKVHFIGGHCDQFWSAKLCNVILTQTHNLVHLIVRSRLEFSFPYLHREDEHLLTILVRYLKTNKTLKNLELLPESPIEIRRALLIVDTLNVNNTLESLVIHSKLYADHIVLYQFPSFFSWMTSNVRLRHLTLIMPRTKYYSIYTHSDRSRVMKAIASPLKFGNHTLVSISVRLGNTETSQEVAKSQEFETTLERNDKIRMVRNYLEKLDKKLIEPLQQLLEDNNFLRKFKDDPRMLRDILEEKNETYMRHPSPLDEYYRKEDYFIEPRMSEYNCMVPLIYMWLRHEPGKNIKLVRKAELRYAMRERNINTPNVATPLPTLQSDSDAAVAKNSTSLENQKVKKQKTM